MVFEAHSTDYQSRAALRALVDDHFAILKVGPGLTFAYREALFALSFVEDELLGSAASGVRDVLDRAMRENPRHWEPFYPADPELAAHARKFSRSDRSRYYWQVAAVQDAVEELLTNLTGTGLPDELVSQFLPWLDAAEVPGNAFSHRGVLTSADVLRAAVRRVLDIYAAVV